MSSTSRSPLTEQDVRWLVDRAALAPSVHNTQPWRFEWSGHHLDLYADTVRGLLVSDPDGREMVISCGAALFNLRLAARKLDARAVVHVGPEPRQPRLLARVDIHPDSPASPAERRLFAAMLRRRTHRGEFEERVVPPDVAVNLQRAADEEGAALVYVSHPGQRTRILHLARAAERHFTRSEDLRAELSAWTRPPRSTARDGVPALAFATGLAETEDDLPGRDFDLGRGIGQLPTPGSAPGLIAALVTASDLQVDWITAGQALQHVLVAGAEKGIKAALHSQAMELANRRAEVRRELSVAGFPQLLLRFGYAPSGPPAPRRGASELLVVSAPDN